MPSGRIVAFLAFSLLSASAHDTRSQGIDYVRANYTKYEFRIPMRDGVRLFTSIYVPKDAVGGNIYPILLNRTPYSVGPYGVGDSKPDLGPSPIFGRSG